MKRMCYWGLLILFFCITLSNNTKAAIFSGKVLLEKEENHNGTIIRFVAKSPSAKSTATTSSENGSYEIDLQGGVYDIEFVHQDYAIQIISLKTIFANTVNKDITLKRIPIILNGALKGELKKWTYNITGDCQIGAGNELKIMPGAELFFLSSQKIKFVVLGKISAIGTEIEPVLFNAYIEGTTLADGQFVLTGDKKSYFDFCKFGDQTLLSIESSCDIKNSEVRCYTYFTNSNSQISNSTYLRNVRASGGAITFLACSFNGRGDGLTLSGAASVVVESCFFRSSLVTSTNAKINNCTFQDIKMNIHTQSERQGGGGLFISDGSPRITNCLFINNHIIAEDPDPYNTKYKTFGAYGGAIFCSKNSKPTISNCIFDNNSTIDKHYWLKSGGHAIYCESDSMKVINCTFVKHVEGDRYNYVLDLINCNPIVKNCLFFGNDLDIKTDADITTSLNISYNCIKGKVSSNNEGLGNYLMFNTNGDSCDAYYNIICNPLFINYAGADYHLKKESPCINAGDPTLPLDSDGSISDIGAYSYSSVSEVFCDNNGILPRKMNLLQNYPNPFNSNTTLSFQIAERSNIKLSIFNLAGSELKTLYQGTVDAGMHVIGANLLDLPSGIYFVRLSTDIYYLTTKITLIR